MHDEIGIGTRGIYRRSPVIVDRLAEVRRAPQPVTLSIVYRKRDALRTAGLLALISLIALTVSFRRDAPEQSDPPIVVRFFLLIAALTYLTTIKVKV